MTQPDSEPTGRDGRRPTDGAVSRRNVLKAGAVTSGTLVLGSTAMTGGVAARRVGGAGFMTVEDFDQALDGDRTFKLLEADGWTLDHAAGCSGRGRGRTKSYTGYRIRFAEGVDDEDEGATHGHLYVEPRRHVTLGEWQDVVRARACPPDGTTTDPDGNESSAAVLQVAFQPTDFGGLAGFRAGVSVVDGEDADPDPAVVLAVFDVPISDWIVYANETVAFQNPGYDPEERVVVVAYEDDLDTGWPDWDAVEPETLFDGVVDRGIKFYAFPQSRLERVRPGR